MRHNRQGSALLLVLIIGSVLLLGLAALLGTALTEHRGAERSALSSEAFHLAEAGIDRTTQAILDLSFDGTDSAWKSDGPTKWTRTFAADSGSLDGRTGSYQVVVAQSGTLFTVSARGRVANAGAATAAERAIEVVFDRVLASSGAAQGAGCIALDNFLAGSTGDSAISTSQVGPTFDSYISEYNTAPGPQNRDNKCLVGTLSSADGALNLSNGSYYATVGTGAGTPAPTVKTATNASPPNNILTKIDDPDDKMNEPVAYDPANVRHDFDVTVDPVIPPDAPAKDGWIQVLPMDGAAQSQWKLNGKLSDFDITRNATAAHMTVSGGVATIGATNTDKHYVATTSLDNIGTLNISGEVILVCLGPINASNGGGMKVNYLTADAKLTIYAAGNLSGVIKTQQLDANGNLVANHEAKRLTIGMLPGNHNINMQSLEPSAINAHVTTAVTNPTDGATITMNFGDNDTFVGQILAPYSTAQLSATGQKGKMSDYCGSLLAKNISITGSNGFAFHFDQSAGGGSGGDKTPTLVRNSWRQIPPNDPVFE